MKFRPKIKGGRKKTTRTGDLPGRRPTVEILEARTLLSANTTNPNVAPVLAISGAPSADEGGEYTLNLASSDAGEDTIAHWTIDWGDGQIETVPGDPSSTTHVYADGPNTFNVSATATDEDGTHAVGAIAGLVSRWSGNGNAQDTINANHGVLQNGTGFGTGKTGQAFQFDGTDDFVSLPEDLLSTPSSITLGAWINTTDTESNRFLVSIEGEYGIYLNWNSTGSILPFFDGHTSGDPTEPAEGFGGDTIGVDLLDGQWHYVAGTNDGSHTKVYIDGQLVGSKSETLVDVNSTSVASAIGSQVGGLNSVAGLVDEVDIYDRALTDAEIASLFNETAGNLTVNVQNVAPVLAISGAPSADEGGEYTLNLASSDAGEDTIAHWTIDWGDGQIETVPGNPSSTTHVYADGPNTFNVSATATDEDGTHAVGAIAGLVSRWSGNGNAQDTINANHGVLQNGTGFGTGKTGQAFQFDGTDDFVSLPEDLLSTPSSITLGAWINTTDTESNRFLVSIEGEYGIYLNWNSTGSILPFFDGHTSGDPTEPAEGFGGDTIGVDLLDGQWHYVAGTNDGSHTKVYIDGQLVGSKSETLVDVNSTSVASAIGSQVGGLNSVAGLVDEVDIYDRALTDAEIASLFNETAGNLTVNVQNVAPVLAISGAPSADEGGEYTLNLASSDAGEDTIAHWTIDWGDGQIETVPGNPSSTTHVYADGPNTFNVSATATDEDGTHAVGAIAGLVSRWSGNGNAQDTINANHGVLQNGTGFGTGKTGQAFQFDGTDDFVSLPEDLLSTPSSITLGAWINTTDTESNRFLVSIEGEYGIYLNWNSTGSILPFFDGHTSGDPTEPAEGFGGDTIGVDLLDGQWHYVAGTNDGSHTKVYIDGQLVGSKSETLVDVNSTSVASAIGSQVGGLNSVAGLVDEVDIYDRALTDAEIASLFNETAGNLTVNIQNVAPVLAISGAPSADEGGEYTLNLASSDAGEDTIAHWTIDWGDGQIETVPGNPSSTTHVYADGPNTFNVSATATDEDGTHAVGAIAGLVSRWSGNGNAQDTINANHGVLQNGTGFGTGKTGQAFQFDGTDDFVSLPEDLLSTPSSITLGAWINTTDTESNRFLVSIEGEYGIYLNWNSTGSILPFFDGHTSGDPTEPAEGFGGDTIGVDLLDGQWHYVAGTNDGSHTKVYIDGQLVGSKSETLVDVNSTSVASAIGSQVGGLNSVAGLVDEVDIYDRALTDAEIASLFNETAGNLTVNVQNVAPVLAISAAPSADEGGEYTLNLASSDAGEDTIAHWTIDWGDGQIETVPGNPSSTTHVYADGPNTFNVSATATDEDGTHALLPGLVSRWTGDGHARDSTGAHDGALLYGVAFEEGKVNDAFSFDGLDDILVTPLTVSYGNGVTFEAWVKTTDQAALVLGDNSGISSESGMGLFMQPNGKVILFGGKGTYGESNFLVEGPVVNDNAYHHVAGTWTGDTAIDGVKLFVDGVLMGSTTALATISTGTATLHIGGYNVGQQNLAGLIDEPAVYNRGLSAAEIESIFHGGSDRVSVAVQNVAPEIFIGEFAGQLDDEGNFSANGFFVDPGSDTWSATVKYGDEGEEEPGLPLVLNPDKTFQLSHQYQFTQPDAFVVEVTIDDGDGGVTTKYGETLIVTGTLHNDDISIQFGSVIVTINGATIGTFPDHAVETVVVLGGDGNDNIQVEPAVTQSTELFGGSGNDTIVGGSGENVINGGEGNDTLTGGAGINTLFGGEGDDILQDGGGTNTVIGGAGDNTFVPGDGDNTVESEPGSTTPEVFADSYQITEDGQLSVAAALGVLANDVDPTATPLSATLATVPAHGVLSLQTDGSFIYEPDVDFIGVDHFTYIASNGTDISSGASVTVDIVKAVDDGEVTTDLEGIVRVGGTTGSDTVVVSQSPDGMNIEVTVNGRVRSVPLANVIEVRGWGREGDDRIDINGLAVKTRMFGGNGNDTIQVSGGLSVSNTFYGGAGNDRLRGGHGNDILFGGSGDDLILGKSGRDLLIGGVGADRIVGSADDDILIAGTAYLTVANTHAAMERWSGDEEIGVRQALVNDYIANNNLILAADDDRDVLTGSSGIDWFLANLGGDGVLDKITDLDDELFANDLDWILAG